MTTKQANIYRAWLPILATWMMMATEGPVVAAFIARLPDPTINLAAYGVAFGFALIFEAPIIMLLSAATTLVHDRHSYQQLRRYMLILNLVVSLCALAFLWPPAFELIVHRGLDLPPAVTQRVYTAMLLLLPWPAAIGLRRFYQGVVLASGRTRPLAIGTALRLTAMAVSCTLYARLTHWDGAVVGAGALTTGVLTEAVAAFWLARPAVGEIVGAAPAATATELSFGRFWRFYYPLMLTSMLALAVQPIVTFFVGRARLPIESLAVLPVVNGVVFAFRCFSLSFQDTALAVLRARRASLATLARFGRRLAAGLALFVLLFTYTPLAATWFGAVSGLPPELRDLAVWALRIACLTPLVSVGLAYQTAAAIFGHKTRVITVASMIELLVIGICLLLGVLRLGWTGAVVATTALLLGRIASTGFLTQLSIRANRAASRPETAPELAGRQSAVP